MIVRKVFRQDDSSRERIEAALKKFFFPQSLAAGTGNTESPRPGALPAGIKEHPEQDPDPTRPR